MESEKALFSTSEAANYLGYSARTIRGSRRTGFLADFEAPAHIKLGKSEKSHVRYEKAALDDWIERAKQI